MAINLAVLVGIGLLLDSFYITYKNCDSNPILFCFAGLLFITGINFFIGMRFGTAVQAMSLSVVMSAGFQFALGFLFQKERPRMQKGFGVLNALLCLFLNITAATHLRLWALFYPVSGLLLLIVLLAMVIRFRQRVRLILGAYLKTFATSCAVTGLLAAVYLAFFYNQPDKMANLGSCVITGIFILPVHQILTEAFKLQNRREALVQKLQEEAALHNTFADYLHDTVLQEVIAVRNILPLAEDTTIRKRAESLLTDLSVAIRERMVEERFETREHTPFDARARGLIEQLKRQWPLQQTVVTLDLPENLTLVQPYDYLLLKWMRELVVNAYKYADARQLIVTILKDGASLCLKVADDGRGFQKDLPPDHGLSRIKEQAEAFGGSLSVQQDNGTVVSVTMTMKGETIRENFMH